MIKVNYGGISLSMPGDTAKDVENSLLSLNYCLDGGMPKVAGCSSTFSSKAIEIQRVSPRFGNNLTWMDIT